MENITIIKEVCSFFWKARSYFLMGFVYLIGRKAAKKEDQVIEQNDVLKDQKQTIQTMQAMDKAASQAPADRSGLIDSLEKGRF